MAPFVVAPGRAGVGSVVIGAGVPPGVADGIVRRRGARVFVAVALAALPSAAVLVVVVFAAGALAVFAAATVSALRAAALVAFAGAACDAKDRAARAGACAGALLAGALLAGALFAGALFAGALFAGALLAGALLAAVFGGAAFLGVVVADRCAAVLADSVVVGAEPTERAARTTEASTPLAVAPGPFALLAAIRLPRLVGGSR